MLSDTEVTTLAAEFENLLSATCVIQRLTTASDGMGGSTSTWAAAGTVLCNVAPLTAPTRDGSTVGGEVQEQRARMVTLPAGTDVRLTDRLSIASETYEVTDLREPRTYEFVRRVEARLT